MLSEYTTSERSSGFKTSFIGNTGSTSILCDLYRPGSKPPPGLQSSQNAKPSLIAKYIFNVPQDTRLEMYRERMTTVMMLKKMMMISYSSLTHFGQINTELPNSRKKLFLCYSQRAN